VNGAAFYKTYTRDLLSSTAGLPFETKAVFRLVLDLIYFHGGKLVDDPRYIAGNLGCSVRFWKKYRQILIDSGKLYLDGQFIMNSRATKEMESLAKLQKTKSENRRRPNKNKDLESRSFDHTDTDTDTDTDTTADERTSDQHDLKMSENLTDRERLLKAMGLPYDGLSTSGRIFGNQADMEEATRWAQDLGLSLAEQIQVIHEVSGRIAQPPNSFKYFTGAMQDAAGRKARPKLVPKTNATPPTQHPRVRAK